jgi:hypothetical protein
VDNGWRFKYEAQLRSIISRKSRFQFNLFCSAVILSLSKDDYGKNASTGSA